MKIERIRKVVLVGSAFLIGIAVCVSVWFFLREHKVRALLTYEKSASSNDGITAGKQNLPQPSQNFDGDQETELLPFEERVARRAKSNAMAIYGEPTTPVQQKILEAMDSPEYIEHLKESRKTGLDYGKWFDFFESKGISLDRTIWDQVFRKYFPTGEPEDYEPEMRLKIAKLFLSAERVNLEDPIAAADQRGKVFSEFGLKNDRNYAWFLGQFDEDFAGYRRPEWPGMESNPALV